jgi:ribA/ribD-fused uncharacterized protein
MNKKIVEFQGVYRWLSNFQEVMIKDPTGLKVGNVDITYKSTEGAYQAMKTLDITARAKFARLSPGKAKGFGRTVDMRENWDDIKDAVMADITHEKFKDPILRQMLISTGDAELQEGNWWGDVYWGICLKTGKGENRLGKIIMAERHEIVSGLKGLKAGDDVPMVPRICSNWIDMQIHIIDMELNNVIAAEASTEDHNKYTSILIKHLIAAKNEILVS